ncbi:MAG: hypothetical protein GY773_01705, partial [Actinomycetia bacterium]|nr:hypothetical protein [Actinomycetes bacterium]
PPPPPPTDPPPPPPGPSDPIPQDPTGPSAVHAPLGQADPTLDEPAGDIASYRPEPEADKGQDKTEDDPNATVVVNSNPTEGDPNTTAVVNPDPTEGDPNATAVVNPDPTEDDPNATVVVSPSPTEDDPNATVVMPGDSNLTGDDPNATVSMSSGSAAPDPDRDQPPHPNAAGPQPSTDATSVLTVVTTTEIPPAPTDPVPAEATQLATPPAPAGTPTEVVSATPEEPSTAEDEPPSVDATPSPGADGGGGDETDKSKGRRRRPLRILILTIVALIVLIYAAWLLDLARASGEVVRGTKLGSTSIAGLDAEGLAGLADELDAELAATGVELSVGDTIVNSNPVTLGAGIDREALSEVALAARRDSNPITGPLNWLSTFFSQETIEPIYLIDESVTSLAVDTIVATELDQPVEPELLLGDEGFTVTPGRDGVQLEASEVVDELMNVLDQAGPFALTLTPITAQPELETAEVEAVASEVNEVTAGGVVFRILDQTAEVDAADLRQWVELNTSGSAPPWSINTEEVIDDLQPMFPALGSEDQQARFSIVDGEPIIIPASETVVCCTPTSAAS